MKPCLKKGTYENDFSPRKYNRQITEKPYEILKFKM